MDTVKRGRGRPRGSKDKRPRHRNIHPNTKQVLNSDLSVEEKLLMLNRPERVSVFAQITGMSEWYIRKKIDEGKIKAFHRSGMLLIEGRDVLAYWKGGHRL
jgi:hypothetical protein